MEYITARSTFNKKKKKLNDCTYNTSKLTYRCSKFFYFYFLIRQECISTKINIDNVNNKFLIKIGKRLLRFSQVY